MAINHYQLLGIPPDVDLKRIKTAYRSLAKRFHPDTNKGSETATELFRQINEAYRILSDSRLRKLYDAEFTVQQQSAPPEERQQQSAGKNPQQKFNRFLNSLLDAVFEFPDHATSASAPGRDSSQRKTAQLKGRGSGPDFNFYYYLAMEQRTETYSCGKDGIYRRQKPRKNVRITSRPEFRHTSGVHLLLFLLAGLCNRLLP
ncbi:MAG: J domain-containing protein [Desulfuromonadales bacterium]|nr:J domain-containing protein [Desulfuromonadales bacterium]